MKCSGPDSPYAALLPAHYRLLVASATGASRTAERRVGRVISGVISGRARCNDGEWQDRRFEEPEGGPTRVRGRANSDIAAGETRPGGTALCGCVRQAGGERLGTRVTGQCGGTAACQDRPF